MPHDPAVAASLVAAARTGGAWRDLRYGWCVARDDSVTTDPVAVTALRLVVVASAAGESATSVPDAAAGTRLDPGLLDAALQGVWATRAATGACLLRLGPPDARRWARWAQVGQVARPLDADRARRLVGTADGLPAAGSAAAADGGPDAWRLLGAWLRLAAERARDGSDVGLLATPAAVLLGTARLERLLV